MLSSSGFIIEMEPGAEVIQQEGVEQDVFVVLDGVLEVRRAGVLVTHLSKGDLFGEMTVFRPNAPRYASVRVIMAARLLVIRRSVLGELERRDPAAALDIYKAMGGVMAERLAR